MDKEQLVRAYYKWQISSLKFRISAKKWSDELHTEELRYVVQNAQKVGVGYVKKKDKFCDT